MKKILKLIFVVFVSILVVLFVIGWAFQDYDTAGCWEIYNKQPQQESLETRIREARKCSHFSVFSPTHLPPGTYLDTGHTWWFPGGLNGEVLFTISQKMPDGYYKKEEAVVIIREHILVFPFRWFSPSAPFDKKVVLRVLAAGGNDQDVYIKQGIHDVKKIAFSDGRTALVFGDHDSSNVYFEKDSTSILLTVPGYQRVLVEAGAGNDLNGLNEYQRILAESKGGYDVKELINIAESFR